MSDASAEPSVNHGEVFTRRWIVDLILDLAGYTPDRDLTRIRLIEPAIGSGAFVEATRPHPVAGHAHS